MVLKTATDEAWWVKVMNWHGLSSANGAIPGKKAAEIQKRWVCIYQIILITSLSLDAG